MILSDTILSNPSVVRAVNYTVYRVMVHKDMLSGRNMDKSKYLPNNISGVSVTVLLLNTFHSCFKIFIAWHTSCVLLESSIFICTNIKISNNINKYVKHAEFR